MKRYDVDNSGSIDINEVSEMMREELHEPIDGADLEEYMAEMDKDGNGVIDFEEFLDWFYVGFGVWTSIITHVENDAFQTTATSQIYENSSCSCESCRKSHDERYRQSFKGC